MSKDEKKQAEQSGTAEKNPKLVPFTKTSSSASALATSVGKDSRIL